MWYRIELDKTGAILKCEEAGENAPNGRFVRYIEASNRIEACSSAKQWWEVQLKKASESKARLRARRLREGRCAECETERSPESKRFCPRHAEIFRSYRSPSETGLSRPPAAKNPELRLMEKREPKISLRRALLEFDTRGPDGFRAWLVETIDGRAARAPRRHWEPTAQAAE